MRYDCVYDEKKDLNPVAQNVAIDLADALKNHVIPNQVSEGSLQYTNIESPANIAGRPLDVFEAMEGNKAFSKAVKAQKEAKAAPASAAPSE